MKPQNWGLASIAMFALATAIGFAIAGTLGKMLDPILSQLESMFDMTGSTSA
jgi:hypothetical protein